MARPPKVVFLTDIITPYMLAVLEALARRVHLTVLFCAETGTRAAEWTIRAPDGLRHRVVGGPTIRRRKRDATDFYPNPRILAALLRERPPAVITSAFSFPSLFAAAYGRLTGAKLIIHSDGTSYSERRLTPVQVLARRLLLREATACVGNSEPAAQRFIELGVAPSRVFRAPHSTNIAPFHAIARDRLSWQTPRDGRTTVLHVGRLIPRKGIDRLIRAVARVPPDIPLRLILVGSGPQEAELRQLSNELGIAGRVQFRGFVDQPALPAVYAEADIFAFPTLDDPFGMVLLEAAATGLPCVASPFGGATLDLLTDGESAFIAEPDDIATWSRALSALATDPELRRRFGARAHAATLGRTPEHAAERYAEAVEAALVLRRNAIQARHA
jgi:glycosyltransferase involved in cell wall biosynthesis